jgi:hypothetical protein
VLSRLSSRVPGSSGPGSHTTKGHRSYGSLHLGSIFGRGLRLLHFEPTVSPFALTLLTHPLPTHIGPRNALTDLCVCIRQAREDKRSLDPASYSLCPYGVRASRIPRDRVRRAFCVCMARSVPLCGRKRHDFRGSGADLERLFISYDTLPRLGKKKFEPWINPDSDVFKKNPRFLIRL